MKKNVFHCTISSRMEVLSSQEEDSHPHLSQASLFIKTQGKLKNDHHQKWSTYLQQFHINIKYEIGRTNRVVEFLNRPPVSTLTTMIHSCGHEVFEKPQIYKSDLDFCTTYQLLGTSVNVTEFHLQDRLLFHLGQLYVPSSERARLIGEAHYSRMARHFGIENTMVILQKHFYCPKLQQDFNKYIGSCTTCIISKLATKK
jgi:hypothetical protein